MEGSLFLYFGGLLLALFLAVGLTAFWAFARLGVRQVRAESVSFNALFRAQRPTPRITA